jgi:hypothetical protein
LWYQAIGHDDRQHAALFHELQNCNRDRHIVAHVASLDVPISHLDLQARTWSNAVKIKNQ